MHIQKYRRNEFVPLMIELVRLYHPKTYVEIGVSDGYTFNQIGQMPQIKRMVGVDIRPMKGVHLSGDVQLYQMPSQDFAKVWTDPIDMLFIDGDHNKETLKHDFFEIGKFVRTGTGLILMHDTHPMTEELLKPQFCHNAWEFASDLYHQASAQHEDTGTWSNGSEYYWKDIYIEVISLPGPWAGISLVRKRGEHHLCWR